MRILTTLAAAAALSLAAATAASACSGYKNDVTAQSPMPQATQQQAEATPASVPDTTKAAAADMTTGATEVAQASTPSTPAKAN